MKPAQILIVDDEANIRFVIERTLRPEGYHIDTAACGQEAIQKIQQTTYDLILLDLYMESVNGLQVFDALRQAEPDTVVIILTAHGSIESAVDALRLGAFDYLMKPATPETIRQRVREGLQQRQNALRKKQLLEQMGKIRQMISEIDSQQTQPASTEQRFLHSGQVIIDRRHRTAAMQDRPLDLTTAEFAILLCLVEAAPNPVAHRELICQALNYECQENEAREITKWHIFNLRQKIEPDPAHPHYIKTMRYQGYFWSGE
ncbi:MAG: response regulator transcription factor [Chloroflexota bacterium]